MPDPEQCHVIVILIDKPCWNQSVSYWNNLMDPVIYETLQNAQWLIPSEINILLTDDEKMRELNQQHRGLNKSTNVLSFPSIDPKDISNIRMVNDQKSPIILGDVALAFEAIQEESIQQNKPFNQHLVHLVVHGILHLLGFDHEKDEDATIMESLEIKILAALKIPNPYQE